MKKRILQFCFLTLSLGIIYLTNVSYSSGAPNDAITNGCYCHNPIASSNTLVITNFNGGNMQYLNGQTYPITVTVSSASNQIGAGFILGVNLGTLSINLSSPDVQASGLLATHTAPVATAGSNPSNATWIVNWTAPASGNTPLQINAVGNAINFALGSTGDEWNFSSAIIVPLPILSITLSSIQINNKTKLIWEMENETNVEKYEVQQSFNGKDFKTIKSLEISANQNKSYSFIDENEYHMAKIQYRILALDMNGQKQYSDIINITNNKNTGSIIYPNTINSFESMTLQLNDASQIGNELVLLNLNGQIVYKQVINTSLITIFPINLASGLYVAGIKSKNHFEFIDKISIK